MARPAGREVTQRRGYGRPGEWQRSPGWSKECDNLEVAVIAFSLGMVFGAAVLAVA